MACGKSLLLPPRLYSDAAVRGRSQARRPPFERNRSRRIFAGNGAPPGPERRLDLQTEAKLLRTACLSGCAMVAVLTSTAAAWAPEQPQQEYPEAVLGGDERVPVHDTTRFPWRAVCQLEAFFSTGAVLGGSAALIARDLVLTAAHCVYEHRLGGRATRIMVAPGRQGQRLPYGRVLATVAWIPSAWIRRRSPEHDLALLRTVSPVGDVTGWFGVACHTWAELKRGVLNVAGYPVDRPESPVEERGKWQYWAVAQVIAVSGGTIRHNADTYAGQSGGPVWAWAKYRLIVAVHSSGTNRYNVATRITEPLYRRIAGLAASSPS